MAHPYRTLRILRVKKDLSQIFLVLVAPVGVLFGLLILGSAAKIFCQPTGLPAKLLDLFLFLNLASLLLMLGYFGYWLVYYLLVRKRIKRVCS